MRSSCLAVALCFLVGPACAQTDTPTPPMPLQDQEKLEALENFSALAKDLANSVTLLGKEKQNQCMKAIGNVAFCQCIYEDPARPLVRRPRRFPDRVAQPTG